MIGKGKTISYTVNAIEYAENKLDAVELDRNKLVGKNPREIAEEFKIFQNMNTRCKRNTFSFVISPSIEDSKNLSMHDYREITRDFLKKMNLHQHQNIAYLHNDKKHRHIHLYVNRINLKGFASKDNYIGKKSQRAAEEIAIERNMIVAREVQKEKALQLQKELHREIDFIKDAHEKTLDKKPKNLKDYSNLMKGYAIKSHIKCAKNGKCLGIKFEIGNKMIKGSTVGKMFSGMRIEKEIEQNMVVTREVKKEKDLPIQIDLQKEIDFIKLAHKKTLTKKPKNLKDYSNLMEKQGIKSLIKFAKNGTCVGMKFEIGDKIIKGSTVGKMFSGMRIEKAIMDISKTIIKPEGRSL